MNNKIKANGIKNLYTEATITLNILSIFSAESLNLYFFIIIEYSSVIALNRTFAYGKVYGKEKAIVEAEKLGLQNNRYYHELLGYLYTDINNQKAIAHYQRAITLSKSPNERTTLQKQIEQLVK